MTEDQLGRIAYNAYGDERGWLTFNREPMPTWEEQSRDLKAAWIAAVNAVVEPYQRAILKAITGTTLADHLGDVRDEEDTLLDFMGVPKLPRGHDAEESESAFRRFQARVLEAGLKDLLPKHAQGVDDDDDE